MNDEEKIEVNPETIVVPILPDTEGPVEADEEEETTADKDRIAEAEENDSEEAEIVNRTHLTPMSAIKAKCRDCCNDQRKEVMLCPVNECPLWPFRKGHKPVKSNRKPMSEERKQAARDRFKKMHADRKKEREQQ